MPQPFLVMATQNPIESEGVYPLPEAQRDRFLMKVVVDYPTGDEEREIVYRMGVEPPVAEQVLSPADLLRLQEAASHVFVHHALGDYVLPQDVLDIAPDVLRHRLVLSYDALADGVPAEHVVHRVLQSVPLPQVTPRQRAAGGPYGSQGYAPSTGSTPAVPTPPPLPQPTRPAEQLSNGPGGERSA
jgi:MoxR-like ATPase